MGADLEVRPATADDTRQIVQLMKLSLGEGKIPRSEAYWSWKHLQNPFGESPVLLATTGGMLVGLRVFMRWEWESAGRPVRAVRAVDTATHPHWQGRGIFSRLTRALVEQMRDDGVSFIYNTPNAQSRPGYLRMGWSDVGRTAPWIRPLRPVDAVRDWLRARRVGSATSEPGEDSTAGHAVTHLLEEPGLAPFLAGRGGEDARLRTRITPAYLRWRYHDVPGFVYRAAWEIRGDGGAVLIWRVKGQGPVRELRVCDLLVGRGSSSLRLAGELLRHVVRNSAAHYVSALAAAGTLERGALLRAAFLPAPRVGPILTAMPLHVAPGVPDVTDLSSWRATVGDLEIF